MQNDDEVVNFQMRQRQATMSASALPPETQLFALDARKSHLAIFASLRETRLSPMKPEETPWRNACLAAVRRLTTVRGWGRFFSTMV